MTQSAAEAHLEHNTASCLRKNNVSMPSSIHISYKQYFFNIPPGIDNG